MLFYLIGLACGYNLAKLVDLGSDISCVCKKAVEYTCNELENSLAEVNMRIAAEECKLERKITKEDVEAHIMDALASEPRTLIEYLIERIVLYEDKIHIFYKHTKQNTDPDEPKTEVHRDFFYVTKK